MAHQTEMTKLQQLLTNKKHQSFEFLKYNICKDKFGGNRHNSFLFMNWFFGRERNYPRSGRREAALPECIHFNSILSHHLTKFPINTHSMIDVGTHDAIMNKFPEGSRIPTVKISSGWDDLPNDGCQYNIYVCKETSRELFTSYTGSYGSTSTGKLGNQHDVQEIIFYHDNEYEALNHERWLITEFKNLQSHFTDIECKLVCVNKANGGQGRPTIPLINYNQIYVYTNKLTNEIQIHDSPVKFPYPHLWNLHSFPRSDTNNLNALRQGIQNKWITVADRYLHLL